MSNFFLDESFWKDTYPFMFSDENIQAGEDQVEKILTLTGVEEGSVLDLCCGPGRHSVWFARKGFTVTGMDISPSLMEKAKERAEEANVTVEWVQGDMREFVRPGAYDLVINMFTSFGYFDEKADDQKVLKNIHESLKPKGVCFLDMMGKECLAAAYMPTHSECLPDGSILVQRHEVFDDWSRIRNEWILIKEGKAKSYLFDLTIYSGQELKDRLAQAGFVDISLYGDLDGNDYDNAAKRLIAVARRN